MDKNYKIISKGTKEREQLIILLKKIKKYEKVIDLDTFSLKKNRKICEKLKKMLM